MDNVRTTSKQKLIARLESGERLKFVFFWGHEEHGDSVTKSCFSQWYPAEFKVDGNIYPTAEHYMMSQKAMLFGDHESANRVLNASHPGEAKAIGREVLNFDQTVWEENKFQIVVDANRAKFSQNENLKDFLVATGKRILVEASPIDKIWGVGMAADDPDIENPSKWRGENLLGFALMDVRETL